MNKKYSNKRYSFDRESMKNFSLSQLNKKQRMLFRLGLVICIFALGALFGNFISGGPKTSYSSNENSEDVVAVVDSVPLDALQEPVSEDIAEEPAKNVEVAPAKEEPAKIEENPSEKNPEEKVAEPAVPKQPIDSTHILSQKSTFFSKKLDNLLRTYHPDYAMYLVVDAKSNEILAWGERRDDEIQTKPDFLSRSTFPAASLIKTVTVAAALESRQYSLYTEIPILGSHHTLYKNQLRPKEGGKYPMVTLQDAYALSSNPPMAIVGYKVGAKALKNAGAKLGFNQTFAGNAPNKSTYAPPDTGYALAEIASGFNELTTISPLLAAAQIRAILMKRPLEIPYAKGLAPYAPERPIALTNTKFSENTYYGLRQAMLRSVTNGTCRKNISTRNMSRKSYEELYIGGKTGSLDGSDPAGRYEWFAGFAQKKERPDEAIVLVIMQVHKEIRSQPATQVAAVIFNYWANNTREKK